MIKGLHGILFDLDGVLVDSEPVFFRAVRDTFRNYSVEISQEEYVDRWMISRTMSSGAIRDYGLKVSYNEIAKLRDMLFEKYLKDMQMIPGALELLQRTYRKYPLAVVSSEVRKTVLLKLRRFDLEGFFQASVCAEESKKEKPYPDPYLKGCELLGTEPQHTLVIEDNPTGAKSGKDAGCKVIARPDGFTKHMNFSLADVVIKEFDEINDRMLRRLFLS